MWKYLRNYSQKYFIFHFVCQKCFSVSAFSENFSPRQETLRSFVFVQPSAYERKMCFFDTNRAGRRKCLRQMFVTKLSVAPSKSYSVITFNQLNYEDIFSVINFLFDEWFPSFSLRGKSWENILNCFHFHRTRTHQYVCLCRTWSGVRIFSFRLCSTHPTSSHRTCWFSLPHILTSDVFSACFPSPDWGIRQMWFLIFILKTRVSTSNARRCCCESPAPGARGFLTNCKTFLDNFIGWFASKKFHASNRFNPPLWRLKIEWMKNIFRLNYRQ